MDLAAVFILEILYSIAVLVLISAGLAVVFGMMRVINLAHGEFMMMGGYATIMAVQAGVNVYIAMLIVAPLVVGIIGLIVERLVIRFLYGRLVDTMLATWGLSLAFTGAAVMIFDEIDRGVGGAVASAIGERLSRLAGKGAKGGGQLLVVTHSPQVAARGKMHYVIHKSSEGTVTKTSVTLLDNAGRQEEIARMLSGAEITDEARAQADRLLEGV